MGSSTRYEHVGNILSQNEETPRPKSPRLVRPIHWTMKHRQRHARREPGFGSPRHKAADSGPRLTIRRIQSNCARVLLPPLRFLVACVIGTAVIHVIEFHLGLGINGTIQQRAAAAGYMVTHCPLRVWIALASVLAVGILAISLMPVRQDLRNLRRFQEAHPTFAELTTVREPVRSLLLIGLCTGLAAIQWLIFTNSMLVTPMTYSMQVHGSRMVMSMSPAFPIMPLCAAVGLIGGVILAIFERRITIIAAIVAALMRAFGVAPKSHNHSPTSVERPPLSRLLGPALFSRPPPALTIS